MNIAPEEPTLRGVGGGQGVFTDCTSPIPPKTHALLSNGGGGGKGVFTVSLPKNGTARSLSPPSPTSCPGQINVAQARHCTSPIPPEEPALHGMRGGGQGVFTVARRPRTALQVAYPPPEKPTILRGEQGGFTVALPKNDTASCLSPPRKTHHSCNGGGGRGCSPCHCPRTALHVVAYPPLLPPHVRDKSMLPKHGTALPLSPPKNPPFME